MNSNETITKNPRKNNKSLLSDIPKAPHYIGKKITIIK